MTELLRAEGLSKRFKDGTWGLRDVSLSVFEGDFLVLAGRNGSGKSLLMRHFLALAAPSSGRALYRGRPVAEDPRFVRSRVGLVFQDPESQILGRTVAEDAAFGPENLGLRRDEIERRVASALGGADLADKAERRPDVLSGGERRRLAVAGILAMESEVLVMDEPFANLDYPSIRRLLELIVSLHRTGRTIVLLTHELEKVLGHATRLALMDGGRIVYDGAPDGVTGAEFLACGLADPYRRYSSVEDLSWLS